MLTNNFPQFTDLYYRIQSIDKDGRIGYSSVKKVTLYKGENNLRIYPNPAKDYVNIACEDSKEILITDCFGRTVIHLHIINNNLQKVAIKQLARGMYAVRFILKNGMILTEKLMVD